MVELGQTNNPKDLIPGEPEVITSDLRELIGTITTADEIGGSLGRIDPVQWVGEASNAFRSAFGNEPPKWIRAVEAAGQGGQSLCDFGDVLTWGQGEAQRAIELYHQAQAASRAAAARYDALAQVAQSVGEAIGIFQDPGQAAAQEAQAILDAARQQVEQAGGLVARALGFESDGEGGYTRPFGENEWGAGQRQTQRRWDPETGQWVEEDPGGWQQNQHGRSYQREWGSQADGLLHDELRDTLAEFGIEIPFSEMLGLEEGRWENGTGIEWMGGSAEGDFDAGWLSGRGKAEGSLLGANAGNYYEVTADGINAGANAEAYLARGSAEGELDFGGGVTAEGRAEGMVGASAGAEGSVDAFGAQGSAEAFVGARAEAGGEMNFGDHGSVSASGEAMAGAEASGQASIGLTGVEAGGEAFAGARASGEVGAEVAGVGAGVNGEAWAGVGIQGSAQFGMGDDGKFHIGASGGAALGVGGKVGFDVTIDPGGVVDAVGDAAGAVGDVASGVRDAAGAVGNFLGF
ncbi:putative T7SS-secreted protein [Saccharomonospora sp. NPDC046836]|uniref:putative T7SS-secreted protein n=1 Tax=Saccharomonospora sp. NPDC046836 TaxID=3156921 RepID=UPI0033DFF1BD